MTMRMRTANPALSDRIFSDARRRAGTDTTRMTINGTVHRTLILMAIVMTTAYMAWSQSYVAGEHGEGATFVPSPWMLIGGIGGFIVAIVTIFKKTWAPFTSPLYAALEGAFLGGISASFEVMYEGIVAQAILLTMGTLVALLLAYRSGLIKVTKNFRLGVIAATGAIFLVYMISFIMSFFGSSIGFIHDSGPIGIGFSLVVVVIASLNLVLDFDFIEKGEEAGAPKYMEWYAAFGLLITLVWLYLEMLRLLAKLRD